MFKKLQQVLCLICVTVCLYQPTVYGQLEQLSLTNDDTFFCPGDVLVFECTVMVGFAGSTIFRGMPDFFECSMRDTDNQEVLLRHNLFNQSTAVNTQCNNDTIIGRIIRRGNDSYISQLNVTFSSDLRGGIIECLQDDGTTTSSVGNSTIITEDIPPLDKVYITEADFGLKRLVFTWIPTVMDCPVQHYNITASNCGSCPTTTTNTTVTCTDIPTDGSMCTFAVKTVVCGGLSSVYSDKINITLKLETSHQTCTSKELLSVFISIVVVLVLAIAVISFVLILRRLLPYKQTDNSLQKNSTSYKMKKTTRSYDDVVKVFDTRSIGIYEESHNVTEENNYVCRDESIDLDQLLLKLKGKVSSQWYLYGLAIGVPKEALEILKDYPEEECLTEVLNYWLRNHYSQPTWSEVFNAKKKLDFYNMATKVISKKADGRDYAVAEYEEPFIQK